MEWTNGHYQSWIDGSVTSKISALNVVEIHCFTNTLHLKHVFQPTQNILILNQKLSIALTVCCNTSLSTDHHTTTCQLTDINSIKSDESGEEPDVCFCQLIASNVSLFAQYVISFLQVFKQIVECCLIFK
jgi:hypothetical protein